MSSQEQGQRRSPVTVVGVGGPVTASPQLSLGGRGAPEGLPVSGEGGGSPRKVGLRH